MERMDHQQVDLLKTAERNGVHAQLGSLSPELTNSRHTLVATVTEVAGHGGDSPYLGQRPVPLSVHSS
jgi:hypothetical protein